MAGLGTDILKIKYIPNAKLTYPLLGPYNAELDRECIPLPLSCAQLLGSDAPTCCEIPCDIISDYCTQPSCTGASAAGYMT